MSNLIELITEISDNETADLDTPMTAERKERVMELISTKLEDTSTKKTTKLFRHKKWLALIVAATLLFSMAAIAANKGQWDIRLMEYWKLTDTTYLNDGAVLIDAKSNESNHMTVTAYSSIGDKNNAAIILEVDITDDLQAQIATLPEDSYLYFDFYDISIFNKRGLPVNSGYASSITSFIEDKKLYFLLDLNCENINRLKVKLDLKNLYLYEYDTVDDTETETLLKEGAWSLEWTYQYAENVKTYYPFKTADCDGVAVLITKIEVSPISIRITGIRSPFSKVDTSYTGSQFLDTLLLDNFQVNKIFLEGNEELSDFEPSVGGSSYFTFLDTNVILSTPTEPGKISGLQIGNTVITLK